MAAMKPRTGNGPMEAVEESRKIVMRIPSDGGGRLVVEMSKEEAGELGQLLIDSAKLAPVSAGVFLARRCGNITICLKISLMS